MTQPFIRRINLFGGPGSGKSTTAAWLFSQLKIQASPSLEIQLVHEGVKPWANEKRSITGFDQLFILVNQLALEESMLRNGVDVLVTDSPLLLSYCYAYRDGCSYTRELRSLLQQFEDYYPSYNVILDRTGIPYSQSGRYESLEQAQQFDTIVYSTVREEDPAFVMLHPGEQQNLLRVVLGRLPCSAS